MTEPLRVLDLRSFTGCGGGAEKIILRTAAMASRERLNISVCCIRRSHDRAFDLDRQARALGVELCHITQKRRTDSELWPRLTEIVRKRQIEVVHAHDYKAVFFAARLAREEGIVPMATCHGWSGHLVRERFVYYPAEKWLLRRFPLIIAVSSDIRRSLIRWGAKPQAVHLVLNGVDPESFQRSPDVAARSRRELGLESGQVAIGAVGRLEREKRFDLLIEIAGILRRRRPSIRVYIAGEGSLRPKLEAQIRKSGLEGCVHLLGHRADVAELYQAFDVVAQTSDNEGTPTVLVEAMALGTPVVATDVGGTRELVYHGEHGLVVPRRNPERLSAAIEQTIEDQSATAARVRAGRERVETVLSFQHRLAQVESLYRSLAPRREVLAPCEVAP